MCQEPSVLEVYTWRTLRVPDWILGGWGHPWRHWLSSYVILDLCVKCQLSSMIRSMSRTSVLEFHTWRTLKVPDWSLGGWVHSLHAGSSWETPRNSPWKFREDLTWLGWVIRSWKICYLTGCWRLSFIYTRISGRYAPFILAAPEGFGGPSAQPCGPSAHL